MVQLTEKRLVDWLNERVYAGKMRSHLCTNSISMNQKWSSMLGELLPIKTLREWTWAILL